MKKVNKPVKAYKGFNKHMQCTPNGKIFQYEIGKEYKEDKADLCHCGFHACENPLDVLSYYNNIDDKFCEVKLDKIDSNRNTQIGSSGYNARIGSFGDYVQIDSSGDGCVIMCAGINSSAKAKIGSWITLAEWKYSKEKQRHIPFSVVTKQVDGIEIKEDVYYTLQDGKFKESEQQ